MAKKQRTKPGKPRANFPLFAHQNGQWAKKIDGKLHYFGQWDDSTEAEQSYHRFMAGIEEGAGAAVTLLEMRNRFYEAKQQKQEAGDITAQHLHHLHLACKRMLECIGNKTRVASLRPVDFTRLYTALSKGRKYRAVSQDVGHINSVFSWAASRDVGLISEVPFMGNTFKKPARSEIRKQDAERENKDGLLMFQPDEIRKMLTAANKNLKAMLLLGINCAFGNKVCSSLPIQTLDLEGGWVTFSREKTGVRRRCPLWPETIAALQVVLDARREPKDSADSSCAFITTAGQRYVEFNPDTGTRRDAIGTATTRLLEKLKIKKKGLGFYSLRRTLQTVSEEVDQIATRFIMGHADDSNDMSATYRQTVRDERLLKVTEHVRAWLLGDESGIVD